MTDADLDIVYSALSESIAEAGPERSPLLLATLCLALLVKHDKAEEVLPMIAQAQRLTRS